MSKVSISTPNSTRQKELLWEEIRRAYPKFAGASENEIFSEMSKEITALEKYSNTGFIDVVSKKKGRSLRRARNFAKFKSRFDEIDEKDSINENQICSLCRYPLEPNADTICLCSGTVTSGRHPRYHKSCMLTDFIEGTISSGFIEKCPQIYCPEVNHSDSQKILLPYNKWSTMIPEPVLLKYKTFAEGYMHFLCGNCHTSRSTLLSFDSKGEGNLKKYLTDKLASSASAALPPTSVVRDLDAFKLFFSNFQLGKVAVNDFYQELFTTHVPDLKLKEDAEVWEFLKIIISMISDPERRASLQLRHWSDRPRFSTTCCNREHCFKCKTKDFHVGKSCADNISTMDSTLLPCPSCNISLTKGDGCDTVTCVCSHKFTWSQALILFKHVVKFSTDYPNDTAATCADILCGLLAGVTHENASHWRNHNATLVDRLVLKSFQKRFPYAPNQMMAKCLMDSSIPSKLNIHSSVVSNWNSVHKAKVDLSMKAITLCSVAALDSLYPSIWDKYIAFTSLSQVPRSKRSMEDSEMLERLSQYKTSHYSEWSRLIEMTVCKSAQQFLQLFGHSSISTLYRRKDSRLVNFIPDHFWASDWSNGNLEISADKLCAKRPGGTSSYPAAFCKVDGQYDTFRVTLEESNSTTNSISFGVCLLAEATGIPALNTSGSDGVGRTSRSFGFIEDRGSTDKGKIYAERNFVCDWRKLKVGDVLTAAIDLESLTCVISLNEEYSQSIPIPNGRYCFAMTFANDHKVRILNEESEVRLECTSRVLTDASNAANCHVIAPISAPAGSVKYLNEFHSKIYSDFIRLLKSVNSLESIDDEKVALNPTLRTMIEAGAQLCKVEFVDSEFISSTINTLTSKDRSNSGNIPVASVETWNSIFSGTCKALVESEARNKDMEEARGYQFLEMYGESAAFVAAGVLVQPSTKVSKEELQNARAFMNTLPFMMHEWYDYNATLSDSLIPELQKVSPTCRCLPRCLGGGCRC